MYISEVKDKITETLQKGLGGHLRLDSNLNPRSLADAIVKNTDILRPYSDFKNKSKEKVISDLKEELVEIQEDMDNEYKKLQQSNEGEEYKTLLGNFINGQLTALEKVNDKIEKLAEDDK